MERKKPKFNKAKAKNVILYLLNRCGEMSKKKLTYLLFYLDFDYFEKYEEQFVGATYIKKKDGIFMKELDGILKEMV